MSTRDDASSDQPINGKSLAKQQAVCPKCQKYPETVGCNRHKSPHQYASIAAGQIFGYYYKRDGTRAGPCPSCISFGHFCLAHVGQYYEQHRARSRVFPSQPTFPTRQQNPVPLQQHFPGQPNVGWVMPPQQQFPFAPATGFYNNQQPFGITVNNFNFCMVGGTVGAASLDTPKGDNVVPNQETKREENQSIHDISEGGRFMFDFTAPAGFLGIVLGTSDDGPVVHSFKGPSPVQDRLYPGDVIVEVDGKYTGHMTALTLANLLNSPSKLKTERKMTLLRRLCDV